MSETQDILNRLHKAVKRKNMLVHRVFHYRCQNMDCGLVKPMYIGYGIEGPAEIEKISIPSPFMGPPCDVCRAETQHDSRVARDLSFKPRIPPSGAYVWFVPSIGIKADEFSSSYMGSHFIAREL